MTTSITANPFPARMAALRAAMTERGVDAVLLSVGAELPWLCGYEAMPLERLTMLVVPAEADATLLVPRLEAPRVMEQGDLFRLQPWGETEDPLRWVAELVGGSGEVAIGDRTWSRFTVGLVALLGGTRFRNASDLCGPLRAVKDRHEIEALHRAGAAVDRIAAELQAGGIPLVGRTEAQVSAELGRRILAEGHHRVNFAIVAAGENAASPHHEPSDRVIEEGEVVLCDFGGTMADEWGVGYCSDITRCVWTGEAPAEAVEVYSVVRDAHAAAVSAARPGTTGEAVDLAARRVIAAAGLGEHFLHRTGHGIGVEEHEDPYIVEGNELPLVEGNCFSIEPGVYLPGRFGFRLEDCVAANASGVAPFTGIDHDLVSVDA
jgi:Xaa-Pro aminopeptidase